MGHISTDGHQSGPHPPPPPCKRKPCAHKLKSPKRKPSISQGTKSRMVSGPLARFLFYVLRPPRGLIIFQFPIYHYKYIPTPPPPAFPSTPPSRLESIPLTPVRTEHDHRRRSPPISTNLHRQATHPGRQQTHLNLNLYPPATDVHDTSPASGTSAFRSHPSLFPIRPSS